MSIELFLGGVIVLLLVLLFLQSRLVKKWERLNDKILDDLIVCTEEKVEDTKAHCEAMDLLDEIYNQDNYDLTEAQQIKIEGHMVKYRPKKENWERISGRIDQLQEALKSLVDKQPEHEV